MPRMVWSILPKVARSRAGGSVGQLEMVPPAVPEPLSERSYSGKFNLRVGEGLHRRLAIRAAEEHLSLNQYVVQRLSDAS